MKITTIVISVIITISLIGAAILLSRESANSPNNTAADAGNLSLIDGQQIITINAKGGYSPKFTAAKAGVPTTLKINTQNTFDCSSALTIPSLGYQNYLPPSGETLINLPPQQAGTSLRGLCSMGMYNFTVNFN